MLAVADFQEGQNALMNVYVCEPYTPPHVTLYP